VDVRLFEQPGTSEDNSPDPGPPYHSVWVSHASLWEGDGCIGPDLFNHLTGEVPGGTFWGDEFAGYPTVADAHRALSAACVRWGREQAAAGNNGRNPVPGVSSRGSRVTSDGGAETVAR
jgi:hypothetical protein